MATPSACWCNARTVPARSSAFAGIGREIEGYDRCVTKLTDPPVLGFDGKPAPICEQRSSSLSGEQAERGSIIVVVATDAPLTPDELQRVARRVTLGMGRMGAIHGNGSGDIFIAFSTANRGADWGNSADTRPLLPPPQVTRLPSGAINPLFTVAAAGAIPCRTFTYEFDSDREN